MAETIDFVIRLTIGNLALFAWLAWGRYVNWSDLFHFRRSRQPQ